jgi:uncharacterized protein (DUF302 family)
VAALDAAIGHLDMAEFERLAHQARSFAELRGAVEKGLSEAGLMLFMQLDQGAVLRKESGRDTPRIIRLIIGNPLIMKEMAKYVPEAGSYAPVTVLADERADGVRSAAAPRHLEIASPSVFHRGRLTFRPERHRIRATVPWRGVSNSELCFVSLCEPLETKY